MYAYFIQEGDAVVVVLSIGPSPTGMELCFAATLQNPVEYARRHDIVYQAVVYK